MCTGQQDESHIRLSEPRLRYSETSFMFSVDVFCRAADQRRLLQTSMSSI